MNPHNENEIIKFCGGTENTPCKYICFIDKDCDEFECPKCNKLACPKCILPVHNNKTCKEMKTKNNNPILEKIKDKEKLQACPNCGNLVQKTEGCN